MKDTILALKNLWTEVLGDIVIVVRQGDMWIKLGDSDVVMLNCIQGWHLEDLPDDSYIWSNETIRELVFHLPKVYTLRTLSCRCQHMNDLNWVIGTGWTTEVFNRRAKYCLECGHQLPDYYALEEAADETRRTDLRD